MIFHLISHRRLGLTLLMLLLVALSSLGTLTISHTTAHATSTGISLSPTSGKPNTLIHIKGNGFGVNEPVVIVMDNLTLTTTISNTQGTINTTFYVPLIAPGSYLVMAYGQGPDQTIFNAPFTIPPYTAITLSAKSIAPGGQLTVKGVGFMPYEMVQLAFSPISGPQTQADRTGKFVGGFSIPPATPLGTYSIQATGEQSGFSASTTVQVQSNLPWPTFGYDVQHDHYNPHEDTLSPSNVANLTPTWNFPTQGFVDSSPAVVNGVLYVGSVDGNVYALNAITGAEAPWTAATGAAIYSSPAVVNGVVYIGSADHKVYAFKASDGTLLWSYTTGDAVDSEPVVFNGVVYAGSADHNLYALDASTGRQIWRYDTGDGIYSSAALANGVLYVGSIGGNVYALRASTGDKIWSFSATHGSFYSAPSVVNGVVYVFLNDGTLYALGTTKGQMLWSYTTGGGAFSSPAVANGIVYIGSYDHNVYALDATSGAKLWSYPTLGTIDSPPSVANGVVYIGSNDNNVYALDATSGAKLWSYATGSAVQSLPAVVNGMLYVGSEDNNVYAFSLPGA